MPNNTEESVIPFFSRIEETVQLSNFFKCLVLWMGIAFTLGSEQAYAWAKTQTCVVDRRERVTFTHLIWNASSAGDVKGISNQVNSYCKANHSETLEFWNLIKERVMLSILIAKFAPGTDQTSFLLNTGHATLIEASSDSYWGAGVEYRSLLAMLRDNGPIYTKSKCRRRNTLGKLLMKIRGYIMEPADTYLGPANLLLGDLSIVGVPFNGEKFFWPRPLTIDLAFLLLAMLRLPTQKTITLHVGTFDLIPYLTEEQKNSLTFKRNITRPFINSGHKIWEKFMRHLEIFREFFKDLGRPPMEIFVSNVLRRCDTVKANNYLSRPSGPRPREIIAIDKFNQLLSRHVAGSSGLSVISHEWNFGTHHFCDDGISLSEYAIGLLGKDFQQALEHR
jgi:ribA/ribD-fused uncharacterized protein